MFLIKSGQLEVELTTQSITLEKGEFFGEMGVVDDSPRTATIVSLTECKLLELKAEDLQHLMDTHPHIQDTINNVMEQRREALEADFIKD